jgi:radical SAM-linked protein
LRALKRAEIPVKFSEGFHPKPKVSFDNPLPVGIASLQERFVVTVPVDVRPQTVKDRLNAHLPEAIAITHCELATHTDNTAAAEFTHYRIALSEDGFDQAKLNNFNALPEVAITLMNKKGKLKKINLKDIVVVVELFNSRDLALTLRSEPGKNVRPGEVLRHIFNLSEVQVKQANIIKLGGIE